MVLKKIFLKKFVLDSSSLCSQMQVGPVVSRYCGPFLNDQAMGMANIPICGKLFTQGTFFVQWV